MYLLKKAELAVSEASITEKKCFTCGENASTGKGEHVIPKWLQKKQNLFNEKIILLNGTKYQYNQLTIPCCQKCNNGFLSKIEKSVKPIFEKGFISNDEEILDVARWLSKILLGILIKETTLKLNRSESNSPSIVNSDYIKELYFILLIIISAQKQTSFNCLHYKYPFSFYFYQINDSSADDEFDLITDVAGKSISLRIGQLGVVFIGDGGMQMEIGDKGPYALAGQSISKLVFRELTARIHYKSSLRDATHRYINDENPDNININQISVHSYSGYISNTNEKRIFKEWNEEEFSYYLSTYMQIDRNKIYDESTNTCKSLISSLRA